MNFRFPLPRTLHMRIMLAIALLQFLVVGLFSVYMFVQLVGNEVTNRQVLGHKMIGLTAPAVERMVQEHEQSELNGYLNQLFVDSALSGIKLKDAQGNVLFSREKGGIELHPLASWLNSSMLGARVSSELRSGNTYLGLLTVDMSNHEINKKIVILLHNVLYLFLILLAVDLLASELLIKYFVAPLGPLALMARDVSQGNWESAIGPAEGAAEEVRHLTNAFVESAKIMRNQIRELEQARTQLGVNELRLRNLVNNMQEVLLETDKNGYVQFLNPVWEMLTGYSVESSLNKPLAFFLIQPQQKAYFEPGKLEQIARFDLQLEFRGQNGEPVWLQMNTAPQYNEVGEFSGIISTLVDVSENLRLQKLQYEHEQNLYKLTITDPLTGVYNRRYFDELLTNLLQMNLSKGRQVALIVIDIDGFKFINDTYGHPVGDEALKSVAKRLSDGKFPGATVVRMAGDEFAVILQNVNEAEAGRIANAMHQSINGIAINLPVGQLHLQASLGVAVAPVHGKTPQTLVRAADVALYHAKKSGRNRVDALSKDMGEAIMDIFSQGFELRNAFSAGMISPFMQPIVNLQTGEIFAYEVLTRLKRGNQYIVADDFVTIAEDLGLIREMDLSIIRQALMQTPRHIHLFLNVSLSSFFNPEFSDELRGILLAPEVRGREITIEFTERQTTAFSENFIQYFNELRASGCKLALDDFGVGYSSYGYLRQLRPEYVKIDGSFVQHVLTNMQDAKIVAQIAELSMIFGADNIAEHIEDEETYQRLLQMGVKYGQGYYFGRPKMIQEYVVADNTGAPVIFQPA